jgi:hypothetical protein
MKNFLISTCPVLIILMSLLYSCKKEEVPRLTTAIVTNITGTSATGGGTITEGNTVEIAEHGICWSKENNPTTNNDRTIDLGGTATFTSNMTELDAATTYYVRAYAINQAGTGYGEAVTFTTLGQAPAALTQTAVNVSTTSAMLNGVVVEIICQLL